VARFKLVETNRVKFMREKDVFFFLQGMQSPLNLSDSKNITALCGFNFFFWIILDLTFFSILNMKIFFTWLVKYKKVKFKNSWNELFFILLYMLLKWSMFFTPHNKFFSSTNYGKDFPSFA